MLQKATLKHAAMKPTKKRTKKGALLRARVSDELKSAVATIAIEKESNEAQIVRQAVAEFVENHK